MGADMANAMFTEGDAADKNDPNDTALLATRTTVAQQIKNLAGSLFKPHIQ